MSKIEQLKRNGVPIAPITSTKAVRNEQGVDIETLVTQRDEKLTELEELLKQSGTVDYTDRFVLGNTPYISGAEMLDNETLSLSNAEYEEESETIILK